jgi:hypothetical protein
MKSTIPIEDVFKAYPTEFEEFLGYSRDLG